jgi:hypothetical protein
MPHTLRMVQIDPNSMLTLRDLMELLYLDLAILDKHVMELDDLVLICNAPKI